MPLSLGACGGDIGHCYCAALTSVLCVAGFRTDIRRTAKPQCRPRKENRRHRLQPLLRQTRRRSLCAYAAPVPLRLLLPLPPLQVSLPQL